jgi:hypothetical protein
MTKKTCIDCGRSLPATEEYFYPRYNRGGKLANNCKDCHRVYHAAWRDSRRLEVLAHYSKTEYPSCCCCGETEPKFLAIDHIFGGGRYHRDHLSKKAGISMVNWLYKSGYPEGFQTLCHNCNSAKGYYGKCPHSDRVEYQQLTLFNPARYLDQRLSTNVDVTA